MTSTFFLPAGRLFFAFPQEPPRSFRRPRGKAVYSLLNGPGWNSQGEGGSFIQAFHAHCPEISGNSDLFPQLQEHKMEGGGEGLCKVVCSFRRCDNKYGEVPVRLFQIRTAYEAHWGRQAEQDYLPRKTVEKGGIP